MTRSKERGIKVVGYWRSKPQHSFTIDQGYDMGSLMSRLILVKRFQTVNHRSYAFPENQMRMLPRWEEMRASVPEKTAVVVGSMILLETRPTLTAAFADAPIHFY